MKKFLMFVLVLFAALAFSFTIASPAENKNGIPIVFDVAIERSPQESRRHSFTFGNELNHQLNHKTTQRSQTRRPPNLVLLS